MLLIVCNLFINRDSEGWGKGDNEYECNDVVVNFKFLWSIYWKLGEVANGLFNIVSRCIVLYLTFFQRVVNKGKCVIKITNITTINRLIE